MNPSFFSDPYREIGSPADTNDDPYFDSERDNSIELDQNDWAEYADQKDDERRIND